MKLYKVLIVLILTCQVLPSVASIWEDKSVGLPENVNLYRGISSRNDTLFLADQQKNIYYSTNIGDTWQIYSDCIAKLDNRGPVEELLILDNAIFVSADFKWLYRINKDKQCKTIILDGKYKTNFLIGGMAKNKKYIFVNDHDLIYRSSDEGITWEKTNFRGKDYIRSLAATDSALLAINENSILYRSFDNGNSWNEILLIDPPSYRSPDQLVIDNNIFYAYIDNLKNLFYSSTDNGNTWNCILKDNINWEGTPASSTYINFDVKDDFIFIPTLYIFWGSSGNIVNVTYGFSSDGGNNWYKANFPEFKSIVSQSYIYKDYVFIIVEDINKSDKSKLYRTKKSDLINYATAIEESSEPQLSVYPNPTREFITIPVETVKIGSIYKIIDILGRVVTEGELSNQHIDVSHLPSGLYNIVFISENQTFYQKFIKN